MDLHPTPFPGKQRPSTNSIKKDGVRIEPFRPQGPPTQTRPKRAFGVATNTNIPIEKPASKPPSAKPRKPWNRSVTSLNHGKKGSPVPQAIPTAAKSPDNFSGDGLDKSKTRTESKFKKNQLVGSQEPMGLMAAEGVERSGKDASVPAISTALKLPDNGSGKSNGNADLKKKRHVGFQEPKMTMPVEGIKGSGRDDGGVCTPMSLIKTDAFGTPYLSAKNCSKCRLDRLETSSYWLTQIKLAESVGKHLVSSTFFRLAMECHAQPFLTLQNELKNYAARHRPISTEPLWEDLRVAYGIANPSEPNKIDVVVAEQGSLELSAPNEANFEGLNHRCLECDGTDNQHKDLSAEEPVEHKIDSSTNESIGDIGIKESVKLKTTPLLKDSSLKSKACGSVAISHGDAKKSSGSNASVKNLYDEKSSILINNSSSKPKTRISGGSADKSGEKLNHTQICGKPTGRNGTGSRMSPNSDLNKAEGNEKGVATSPQLSPNSNADETGEGPIINQHE